MQKTKALNWLFPENVRRVEKQSKKPADFCWGTCLGISRGVPEVWAQLAYARDSRDVSLIPGSGRSSGEENGNPLCREPVWGIPPVTRSWGRKLTYERRAQTSGSPLEITKHVPLQKSAGFCALRFLSSDIFWKKSIQGFNLLHLKECFNPKTPLMAF